MKITFAVDPVTRAAVDAYAARRSITFSQAVRILLLTGAGYTLSQAQAVNVAIEDHRIRLGGDATPDGRHASSGVSPNLIQVRLSSRWAAEIARQITGSIAPRRRGRADAYRMALARGLTAV